VVTVLTDDVITTFRLRSEFAMVELEIRERAVRRNDPNDRYSVTLRDLENGRAITLDTLELESLTRMDHADFGDLIVDHYPTPEEFTEFGEHRI
jgi:hypothetical protein